MRLVIECLAEEQARLQQCKDQIELYVAEARRVGCTWTEIGHTLGMTRQSAQRKFNSNRRPPSAPGNPPEVGLN